MRYGREASIHRIGTKGRELVEDFAGDIEAGQALEAVALAKRQRGYRDL
jgi:predicted DNA-binding WGR domain protein